MRADFLRNPQYLERLNLYDMVRIGLRLASRRVDNIVLVTARRADLGRPISGYLRRKGLSGFFSAALLRPITEEDRRKAKVINALDAGVTVMIEEDRELIDNFVDKNIMVAVPDRVWNSNVPDGPKVMRFGEVVDFGVALSEFDGVEELFDYNFKVRLGGERRVQTPWRATVKQLAHALTTIGESREAEEARSKFIADTEPDKSRVLCHNYRLQA